MMGYFLFYVRTSDTAEGKLRLKELRDKVYPLLSPQPGTPKQ